MTKCLLVELDYKALEAQLVGFFANDPDYIRAAKLGVHAILMSHVLKQPIDLTLPDATIKPLIKEFKKNASMYDGCKHVVHGSNYLGTPRKLRIEFPELFSSVGDAKEKQDMYFSTIAKKVRRWQQSVLHEANQNHYLQNPYGYRHYFWDVLHYKGGQLEWGNDAKKSVAFLPQSTGAGVLSEALIRITKYPDLFRLLRWIIHDSILSEIPINKLFHHRVRQLKELMEDINGELGGLKIEVDVKVGVNWGEMFDYREEFDYESSAIIVSW
jgi:hypothetical protein